MYQIPITVAKAVAQIEANELVLPAIQRELVWDPEQIENVWDSLLRGYPIGSFLFWTIPHEMRRDVRLYHFMTDFDVRSRHNIEYEPRPDSATVAVLDGQQRLSAMNIGLRGSYRTKLPHKRWDNSDAFPKRTLCLSLDEIADEPDAEAREFNFSFLSEDDLAARTEQGQLWFPVPAAREMVPAEGLHVEWLQSVDAAGNRTAFKRLQKLVTAIHGDPPISYFREESMSLDRILNIFIRANSGGTQLSFSDLLLSMAVAQWDTLDARQEINSLQDAVNGTGHGFEFGRDRLLKAALVLGDFDNIKFRADNFGASKMSVIEEGWPEAKRAVLLAAKLIGKLGFDAKTLRAENALLPVAYFLKHREIDEKILISDAHAVDRERIHKWLAASFLRSGYWTGAVDGVLLASRDAIKETSGDFPLAEISDSVRKRTGKLLTFEEDDVDTLLDEVTYGGWRAVLCLQLIFGSTRWTSNPSIDHLHPRAQFNSRPAEKRGWSAEEIAERRVKRDLLPNLQTMALQPNQEKSATPLDEWLDNGFGAQDRAARVSEYLLDGLSLSIDDFDDFYNGRRGRMKERLVKALCD